MIEQLNKLLHNNPFRSFNITLTNGDRYKVENPDLVIIAESMLVYCYPKSDRLAYIRLNQIVNIETLQQAA